MFCSSDFVARGSISSVHNDDTLQRTLVTVRASRVIRQVSPVFARQASSSPTTSSTRTETLRRPRRSSSSSSRLEQRSIRHQSPAANRNDDDAQHYATLHVPIKCQAKHGTGEFLFMGRQRLGDAILWCAPRAEDWSRWVRQAQTDGTAQCRLEL